MLEHMHSVARRRNAVSWICRISWRGWKRKLERSVKDMPRLLGEWSVNVKLRSSSIQPPVV
jgi:hypothetical protein